MLTEVSIQQKNPAASALRTFLGPKICFCFLIAVITGLCLFLSQVGFAFALQIFLVSIGLAKPDSIEVPSWLVGMGLSQTIVFVVALVLVYGAFRGIQIFIRGYTIDEFKYLQRLRLTRWVYAQPSTSTSKFVTLFSERVSQSATAIGNLQQAFSDSVICLCLITSLFVLSPYLAALTLSLTIVGLAIVLPLYRSIGRESTGILHETAALNSRLVRGIKNLLLLRIYNMTSAEKTLAEQSLNTNRKHSLSFHKSSALAVSLVEAVGISIILGSTLFAQSQLGITPGVLISFFFLFVRLIQTLTPFVSNISFFRLNLPQIQELRSWYTSAKQEPDSEALRPEAPDLMPELKEPPSFSLESLSFGFEKPLASHLTIKIHSNTLTAIKGPSGSGKTSFLSLLIGQLKPLEGDVFCEAPSFKKTSVQLVKNSLSSRCGYVGTDPFIFSGSLRENLLYGLAKEPSERELHEAIGLAKADFIWSLPKGLEHLVSEQETGISTGQFLRIALARALLRQPLLLILDEPSANLDETTEDEIFRSLAALKSKMTIVVASHRHSIISFADQCIDFSESLSG